MGLASRGSAEAAESTGAGRFEAAGGLSATSLALALFASASALVPAALADPAPTSAAQDAAPLAQLPEVIVTARKRSEAVEEVPATVSVLEGSRVERQGVKDLFQAVALVPGAIFSRAPDDGLALTFRGLGTAARSQAFEQSEAVFTDGVFEGKGRLYAATVFDVDRIEFIKGGQSTLLGKNASIGGISIVSRQPGQEPSFEGRAGFEAVNGGYSLDAAGDAPLSDSAAMRLAAHYNDLNGWVHNDITDHDGPEHRDLGLRAILRDDVSQDLSITAEAQYADNAQIGASYHLIGAIPPAYGAGTLTGPIAQFTSLTPSVDTMHDIRSGIASLTVVYQPGLYKVTSQTAYVGYGLDFTDDFDFSKDDDINFLRRESYGQATEELRVESPSGRRLEYLAGAFLMWSHWDSTEDQLWRVPAFPPPPDPTSGMLFNGPFSNHFVQNEDTYSAFGSAVFHVSDALRLTGGLRYTVENKRVVYARTALAPFTIWNQIANPPFDPTPLAHDAHFVDGDLSLQYDLSRDVMAYVSFAHGSKSGGFAETNTIAVPPSALVDGKVPPALVAAGAFVKDEFARNYEIGVKSFLFDRRLRMDATAFWTDIADFQDTVFTGGPLGFITFNGPARSRGVEVAGDLQAAQGLRLNADLTYAVADQIIQPINPVTDLPEVDSAGNPVLQRFRRSQAPRVITDLGADDVRPLNDSFNLHVAGALRYRSMMYAQRQQEFPSAPLTTLDLSAGVETANGRWGVDLVAKNVTNAASEDFASPSVDPRFSAFYGAYLAGSNPGRTVTLSAFVRL
jgi:iron complex outermembrane receptor protein